MGKITLAFAILMFIFSIRLDSKYEGKMSASALVAFFWLIIDLSRNVSKWINIRGPGLRNNLDFSTVIEKGNVVDQVYFSIICLFAIIILYRRRTKVLEILGYNKAWTALFVYCLVSIIWSDFPYISMKRYIKDLNALLMALILLTEKNPNRMFKIVVRRAVFLLVPLSIVFCKYFPEIGRYQTSSWEYIYTGVATHKNPLGILCLIGILVLSVDILELWNKRAKDIRPQLVLYVFYVILSVYLLGFANSMTSNICLFIGMSILLSKFIKMHLTKFFVFCFLFYATGVMEIIISIVSENFFNMVNRDASLSGRTDLWEAVVSMDINPFLGTGYSAFWIGERLIELSNTFIFQPKQAHNGYIEVYLNLGVMGLIILIYALLITYKRIFAIKKYDDYFWSFQVSYFILYMIHNVTEATFLFNISPLWFVFLYIILEQSSKNDRNSISINKAAMA